MRKPILVLQYPDPKEGRTVAMAATRNLVALQAFKKAVLEEAALATMDCGNDEILCIQNQTELTRLEKLLEKLIPDDKGVQIKGERMRKTITEEPTEKIEVSNSDEAISIIRTRVDYEGVLLRDVTILNKREALELYQFIGQWIRGGLK
tara:strand:+ start:1125 stop:1571 length:447 start_codon:yes stop_codon:yes gene_type:complete